MKLTNNFGRAFNGLGALGLLIALAVPSLIPAFASADVIQSRSIELSSAAAAATNVTYNITFTPQTGTTKGVVVDFCQDSPIIGQACANDAAGFPGFDASSATLDTGNSTSGFTMTATQTNLKFSNSTGTASGTPINLVVQNVTNPTNVGSFYARITTYGDSTSSTYTSPTSVGTHQDEGGIAMSTTSSVAVSAAVKETMTFCVTKTAPTSGCANTSGNAPNLTLGHGTPATLDSTAIDTDTNFAQISTNAASGAVVRMKIDNNCGGLKRYGATGCDIAAAGANQASDFTFPNAKFGMKFLSATPLGTEFGTLHTNTNYTNYSMDTSATGVTSTYGDQIFDTSSAPAADMNVEMQFAAGATATTPAGLYQANLSLIATGTY